MHILKRIDVFTTSIKYCDIPGHTPNTCFFTKTLVYFVQDAYKLHTLNINVLTQLSGLDAAVRN